MAENLLKTRQVAQALGVSVSAVKRWVDAGQLRASRTVGGHRLVTVAEALRFARERDLPAVDLELLADVQATDRPETPADALDRLTTALKRGRVREARALIAVAYVEEGGAVPLADERIRPALERIGHDWEGGSLDVFQEHRASRIVEAALIDLIHRTPSPAPGAPLAIGATPEGDLYTIPALLCELTLRELGWEVMNLGANLPLGSLARAVQAHRPRLVFLSLHHVGDRAAFLREYDAFYRTATTTGAAVILGGPALAPELRPRLVAASLGERMAHLAEFARRLAEPPVAGTSQVDPTDPLD